MAAQFGVTMQPGRPYWKGPPSGLGNSYMPSWSEQQVTNTMRDATGRVISVNMPHYMTRSPRQQSHPDAATWSRLHEQPTHAKQSKMLAQLSPRGAYMRPPDVRPFAQPSVPSPRMPYRPASARAYPGYTEKVYPLDNFPSFKNINPRLLMEAAAARAAAKPQMEEAPPTPQQQMKAASPVKKVRAIERVSADAIRQAAAALKEKLLDKFGTLQKAFRAIDNDGSGTITRQELELYLDILNLKMSMKPEVVDALFELIDADESGNFDYKEFARVMSAGDVMKMESVQGYYDGFKAKAQEEEDKERKRKEYEASLVGMTVEEYEAYWGANMFNKQQTSADQAQVARDRWGHKIKGSHQNFAT